MLTQEKLKSLLSYDPETGAFTWLITKGKIIKGSVAGYVNLKGYRVIMIDQRAYLAHRLAWLYVYDCFPVGQIDHRNRIKTDNCIENLRDVTNSENQQNKPGVLGAAWEKRRNHWTARIVINGKAKYLGSFQSEEQASAAYLEAKKILHPKSFCI